MSLQGPRNPRCLGANKAIYHAILAQKITLQIKLGIDIQTAREILHAELHNQNATLANKQAILTKYKVQKCRFGEVNEFNSCSWQRLMSAAPALIPFIT